MYNALLTVTVAGTLYCRDIVLAFIPHSEPFIDLHAQGKPTMSLRVQHIRNRVSHKQQGFVHPIEQMLSRPWYGPQELYPTVSIRAFIQGDVPGLTIPGEHATEDQLKLFDVALAPWGLKRISEIVQPVPAGHAMRSTVTEGQIPRPAPKKDPYDLHAVFTKDVPLQWYTKGGLPATVTKVTKGGVIRDLRVICESEAYDDSWQLIGHDVPGGAATFAHVAKDAVQIPVSSSVLVTFLKNMEFDWTNTDGRTRGQSVAPQGMIWCKAVLANPLNPDQVAFILKDNSYALLPSSCCEPIELPAGDLTDLPKFQKPTSGADYYREDSNISWVKITKTQTCQMGLADDTVSRTFNADEYVLVRQRTSTKDYEKLLLQDGHTWILERDTVKFVDLALWIVLKRPVDIKILRPALVNLEIPMPKGARILVEKIAWTAVERGHGNSQTRRFTCSGKNKYEFDLQPDDYQIGMVPVRHNCTWINGPIVDKLPGITNVVCDLLETVSAEVSCAWAKTKRVSLPVVRLFAVLVESMGENYVISLPNGRVFEVHKTHLRIVGGLNTEAPQDMNAVLSAAIAK